MKGSKIGVSFNGGGTDTMFICQIPNMARDNNKYIKRIIWPWVIQLSCVPDIYQMELKPVAQVTLTGWCWEYSDVLFKTLHWEAMILPCFSGFRGLSQEHLWKHSVQTSPQNFWFSGSEMHPENLPFHPVSGGDWCSQSPYHDLKFQ